MPKIKAFRGIRYNHKKIKRLAKVVAPPYDVITKKQQQTYYQMEPRNVIRLILGKDRKGDTSRDNKYTRAGKLLNAWLRRGVLKQDEKPSLYVYLQDYVEESRRKSRLGFIAAMKLDRKSVLRHEDTLRGPKKDRLALLKAARTNLSPLFGLFEDRRGAVRRLLRRTLKRRPAADLRIDGVRHRFYVEDREEIVEALCAALRKKPMYIADGHHRFDVTCQYRDWVRRNGPRNAAPGADYVMTYFADYDHNPYKVYPTHRVIKLSRLRTDPMVLLSRRGRLRKVSGLKAVLRHLSKHRSETADKKYSFGVYTRKGGFRLFTLDDRWAPKARRHPAQALDVAVLHEKVLDPCFGIRRVEKSDAILFTRDAAAALGHVQKGGFDAAFFLRPGSLDEMIEVSKKGLKMPQKSTYFYPKLLSGLVFHSLKESAV